MAEMQRLLAGDMGHREQGRLRERDGRREGEREQPRAPTLEPDHAHGEAHENLRQLLRQRALGLLARREHSRHELRAKLRRSATLWLRGQTDARPRSLKDDAGNAEPSPIATPSGAPIAIETLVNTLLDELDRRGLQSDARSAEVLVTAKASRWGQRRLEAELQRRGIDDELTEQALLPLAGNEQARATALWQRRFGAAPTTPQERARQMRFLAARGFTMDIVLRVLRGAGSDVEDNSGAA